MPQPTAGDVHVNRPLGNMSVAYIQRESDFIASVVAPNIPVQKQSDRYFTYPKEYWFRSEADVRALSAESAGGGYTVDSTPTYFATKYAVHKDIDDDVRTNSDDPLDADRDATLWVTRQMLIKKEKLWFSTFFKTSVWDLDQTGVASAPSTNQFIQFDKANSDPTSVITAGVTSIWSKTGLRPNTLIITPDVLQVFMNHTLVLDRIKYTQRGIVTTDILASLFGLDRVLVAGAVENTANEAATASMGFMGSKAMLLCYVNQNPGIMQPSAMYTFSWAGLLGASAFGSRIKRFRIEHRNSDRVEAEMAFDLKVVATDLARYYTSALS